MEERGVMEELPKTKCSVIVLEGMVATEEEEVMEEKEVREVMGEMAAQYFSLMILLLFGVT